MNPTGGDRGVRTWSECAHCTRAPGLDLRRSPSKMHPAAPHSQAMSILQTPRDRAVALILCLAVFVAVALAPFFSGLLGALVLNVAFGGAHRRLGRVLKPGLAASLILLAALAVIALPAAWLIGLVIEQAPEALRRVQSSDVLTRV